VGRNYRKKWGEIDIIAKTSNIYRFIEVKSVSCENIDGISQETDGFRPEDNVHRAKILRLSRAIQTYIAEYRLGDIEWEFDVIAVYIDVRNKRARVRYLPNIIVD